MGARPLQDVIERREELAQSIREIIEETARAWGTEVESMLIKDLLFSTELQESLSLAAQSRRAGEAKVITARAEVEVSSYPPFKDRRSGRRSSLTIPERQIDAQSGRHPCLSRRHADPVCPASYRPPADPILTLPQLPRVNAIDGENGQLQGTTPPSAPLPRVSADPPPQVVFLPGPSQNPAIQNPTVQDHLHQAGESPYQQRSDSPDLEPSSEFAAAASGSGFQTAVNARMIENM